MTDSVFKIYDIITSFPSRVFVLFVSLFEWGLKNIQGLNIEENAGVRVDVTVDCPHHNKLKSVKPTNIYKLTPH